MKAALSPLQPLVVQPASGKDAALIRMLAQRIWPVCFAGILTPEQIENMLETIYSIESLREQMQHGQRFWTGIYEGEAAGYVSAYRDGDSIWLKKLYCDPVLQGRGIGTAMMECAMSAFLPAQDLRLLVNRDNVAAQRYYERKEFKRIGEVPVNMGDFPFVDYLYCKNLTHPSPLPS